MDSSPLERLAAWLRARPFAVDAAAVALVVLFLLTTAPSDTATATADLLLQLALVLPLAWRRRATVPAAAAVTAVCLAEVARGGEFLPLNVAALVMVHALAAHAGRRAGRTGLGLGLLGAVLGGARFFSGGGQPQAVVISASAIAVTVVAAWALGDLRRARGQQVDDLRERARLLELERAQEMRLAAGDERARIARELHDVVAHSLSVVVAQADGGRYAGRTDPAAAVTALTAIGDTGRSALTDMRALLGVLREGRDGGRGAAFAPQPDVEAIGPLVADVRASGLDVDLLVEGATQPLPAGPELAAYRIVQESLTNVLKHAGPAARAWVRLQWRADALEVSVLDDGRGAAAPPDGHGHGVRGMQERARLHGGRLEAGPREDGGFLVHATLPYRALP